MTKLISNEYMEDLFQQNNIYTALIENLNYEQKYNLLQFLGLVNNNKIKYLILNSTKAPGKSYFINKVLQNFKNIDIIYLGEETNIFKIINNPKKIIIESCLPYNELIENIIYLKQNMLIIDI